MQKTRHYMSQSFGCPAHHQRCGLMPLVFKQEQVATKWKAKKSVWASLPKHMKHKSKGHCRLVLVYVGWFWSLFDSGVGQKLQLFSIVLPNCALNISQPICSHFFIIPAQYPARDPRPADGEWWLDLQLPRQLVQLIWALPPPYMVFKTLKCQQYHWFPNQRCPVLDDLGSPFRSSVLRGPHFEVTWKDASQVSPWSIPDPWHRKTHQWTPPARCQRGPLQPARPSGWSRSEWQSSGGQMPGDLILLLFWYSWKGRCNLSPSVLDCMMCWVWLFDKDLVWFRPFTPRKHINEHKPPLKCDNDLKAQRPVSPVI